jgi:uncharacterized protein (DUF362 family)
MGANEPTMGRREAMPQLLRLAGAGAGTAAAAFWLREHSRRPTHALAANGKRDHTIKSNAAFPELAVGQGDDPRALVRRALHDLGGVGRFIARHNVVVLKPNIAWDRTPEQAANTNPDVVAEAVRQCWQAGAKGGSSPTSAEMRRSGAFAAPGFRRRRARGAGGHPSRSGAVSRSDLGGVALQNWQVYRPFLDADKIINLPIAKHHALTGATLGFKNWFGILGGQRNRLHQQIHLSLVDLAAFMLPTLTLLDCYRMLLRNGPTGGDLEDVALKMILVAGTDPVALDAYAAKAYWYLESDAPPYRKLAE